MAKVNVEWLEGRMAELGITKYALRREHGFHWENLARWAAGFPARPHTLRKLAGALEVEFVDLVRNLGVTPMSTDGAGTPPRPARRAAPRARGARKA